MTQSTEPAPVTDSAPATAPVQPTPTDMDAAIRARGNPQPGQAAGEPPVDPQSPEPVDAGGDKATAEKIRKVNSEAANLRKRIKELEPLAELGKQLEAASKSDLERLEGRAAGAEQERDQMRTQLARLTAAHQHSIPADLVDLLGSGSEDEINARAELLAEKLAAANPPQAPAAPPVQRPVESLRPGAAPAGTRPEDPNAWIRRLAGR
jgi:hypothetical protein